MTYSPMRSYISLPNGASVVDVSDDDDDDDACDDALLPLLLPYGT